MIENSRTKHDNSITKQKEEGRPVSCGLLLLAGGRADRMGGAEKGMLRFQGRPLLGRILEAGEGFQEIILSAGKGPGPLTLEYLQTAEQKIPVVPDQSFCMGKGPLAGLYSGLEACVSEALLAAAWDMPFLSRSAMELLLHACSGAYDAFVPVDREGRLQPLFAVYRKSCLPQAKKLLTDGAVSMKQLLQSVRTRYLGAEELGLEDRVFHNINTDEAWRELLFMQ